MRSSPPNGGRARRALSVVATLAVACALAMLAPSTSAHAATGADLCAQTAFQSGFRETALVQAIAVGLAESGCNPAAANPSGALGIWQIHGPSHPQFTTACLLDAQCNADATYRLSQHGTVWSAWSVFTDGSYAAKVPAAQAAIARLPVPHPTDTLPMNRVMGPGDSLVSAHGGYVLLMQLDGNAVLYQNWAVALWSSRTQGYGASLILQSDGNLVVYSAAGRALYANAVNIGPYAKLVMLSNGNLTEFAPTGAVAWTSGTPQSAPTPPPSSPPPPGSDRLGPGESLQPGAGMPSSSGVFILYMQGDGNLVAYSPTAAIWAVTTEPGSGASLVMQTNGDLVLWDRTTVRWRTYTDGNPGAVLVIQNDGNLVLYAPNGTPLWASNDDWHRL